MPYYAQLSGATVVAVTQAAERIQADHMIEIDGLDSSLLGATYADGVFTRPVVSNIPASVTMRQARLALLGAGKLAAVESAIASLPEPQKTAASIEWGYSNEVQRHNGFVSQLAPLLGMTEAQIDALFTQAQSL